MTLSDKLRANPLASREDTCAMLLDMTAPLLEHFSPGRAFVVLGPEAAHFNRQAAYFEGFARPLWGLAPLHAGGGDFGHWELWREGIRNGTNPAHPEYWQPTTNHNQRSVEMAALGFALALAPEKLWDGLDEASRANLITWLSEIQNVNMADNNWHFFPVMAGLGLERIGVVIDQESKARHLARIDEIYRDEGWYGDGPGGYIDHYNGFAIHFYGLIYARHMRDRDPERSNLYIERATKFAQSFREWFGADGAALIQGRSLTYRFACAGFWAALAYAGVEALPWGEIRGIWVRQMRWWMPKEMFDARGVMTVGFGWSNYLMSEEYNSPGSPYWAFKAFLPLALGEAHPFWTAAETPLEQNSAPRTNAPAWMITRRENGDVVALMAGPPRLQMRNAADKYAKFAYSTRFGLCVESDRWTEGGFFGDNILAFSRNGYSFSARSRNLDQHAGDGFLTSHWQPIPEATIHTLQGFAGGWELRVHRISATENLSTLESGHAAPARCGTRRGKTAGGPAPTQHGLTLALNSGHVSTVVDLTATRSAIPLDTAPNTNLIAPHAAVGVLAGDIPAGETVLITAVRAFFGPGSVGSVPGRAEVAELLARAGWPAQIADHVRSPVLEQLNLEFVA